MTELKMNFLDNDDDIYGMVMKEHGIDWMVNILSRFTLEDKAFIYSTMKERLHQRNNKPAKKRYKEKAMYNKLIELFDTIPMSLPVEFETFDDRSFWNTLHSYGVVREAVSLFIYSAYILKINNTAPLTNISGIYNRSVPNKIYARKS